MIVGSTMAVRDFFWIFIKKKNKRKGSIWRE